ncbi:hypothetical protein EYZ11_008651 [Aspergillus tanneri]|uniref:Uncharacterized protein n=1 Tax=Aspergillus tanneri TaxID=1220188 RepID=A0A4V3UNN2_9EURO|nr:hypothetical protein EYZ11_008651 [Aspergillus tanneri]
MYGGHKKIVASLLNDVSENPPPANFVNSSLQVTAFLGNHDFVGMLLDYGAAKGRGDFLGNTLQAASHHRDEKIFHQLLEKGPDVNGKGGQLWESSPGRVISRPSDDCTVDIQGGILGTAIQAATDMGRRKMKQLTETLKLKGLNCYYDRYISYLISISQPVSKTLKRHQALYTSTKAAFSSSSGEEIRAGE